jgi:hypothetical protein
MPAFVVCSLALAVMGAVATYALPDFNIALPNFSSFPELIRRDTGSAPLPGPDVSAALKDIQSAQERNAAALQENGAALQQNTAMLQVGAAAVESLRQGLTPQQNNLKAISNQLASLMVRVDSLQNALAPLTTSSIPQPNRARLGKTSRKKQSQLRDEPVGPVSLGGAPLKPTPGRARVRLSAADARPSGPTSRSFTGVIEPVQSKNSNEDQVDSYCEAQNAGCDHEERSPSHSNEGQ